MDNQDIDTISFFASICYDKPFIFTKYFFNNSITKTQKKTFYSFINQKLYRNFQNSTTL